MNTDTATLGHCEPSLSPGNGDTSIPVIVLGGHENAVSVSRSLGSRGIKVAAVTYAQAPVRFSRYARYVHLKNGDSVADWERFLLSEDSDHLRGSVILCCSDDAISLVVRNHSELSRKFLLEEGDPVTRRILLDKFETYQRAEEAGIPTVRHRLLRSHSDLKRAVRDLGFPLIMKAVYGPHADVLGSKAILISEERAAVERFTMAAGAGIPVVAMEYIPGGDDALCSYYTYLDECGRPLVHLTKCVKRRYPRNSGGATYHVTKWIPEAAQLGLQFFQHIKFRGVANIEFKHDQRDGKLKIIESNARFTAANCLITKSGVDLAFIAYKRITGQIQMPMLKYKESLSLCWPIEDAFAAWELRNRGELRLSEWVADLRRIDAFPLFELADPAPAVWDAMHRAWRLGVSRRLGRLPKQMMLFRNTLPSKRRCPSMQQIAK